MNKGSERHFESRAWSSAQSGERRVQAIRNEDQGEGGDPTYASIKRQFTLAPHILARERQRSITPSSSFAGGDWAMVGRTSDDDSANRVIELTKLGGKAIPYSHFTRVRPPPMKAIYAFQHESRCVMSRAILCSGDQAHLVSITDLDSFFAGGGVDRNWHRLFEIISQKLLDFFLSYQFLKEPHVCIILISRNLNIVT